MAYRLLLARVHSPAEVTPSTPRLIEPTEIEWQAQVVQLAHTLGWEHLHVRRSIGKGKRWVTATNLVGWPDLFLFHPRRGFVALELKVGKNAATDEQVEVLAGLAAAGARTMIAYPHDLAAVTALLGTGGQEQ